MNARKIAEEMRESYKTHTSDELLGIIGVLSTGYNQDKFDSECLAYKISVLRSILEGRRRVDREAKFKKLRDSNTSFSRRVKK